MSDASDNKIPVVFLHGFACGLALWANNIDCVAKTHTVHALDLLGKQFYPVQLQHYYHFSEVYTGCNTLLKQTFLLVF